MINGQQDLELVGVASDLPRLHALIGEASPDVEVTDIRMPPTGTDEGIQAATWLRQPGAEFARYGGHTSCVAVLARGMSPPHFPIGPDGLRGEWSFASLEPGELEAGWFAVTASEIPHEAGRTFGYRVSDGRATVAYLPDHCPTACGPGPDGWAPTTPPPSSWPPAWTC